MEESHKSDKFGIWTIELNLDGNFEDSCCWHVDTFKSTSARNIRASVEKREVNNWAIVGLANNLYEANEKATLLRRTLCDMHGKKEKNLPFAL